MQWKNIYLNTINVFKKNKVTREKKLQKYNIEKSPTLMNTCVMNLNSTLVCITNVFENKIISSIISRLEYHSIVLPHGNTQGMYLF